MTVHYVRCAVDKVVCHEQADEAALDTASEPYLWLTMFAIDGASVVIENPPRFTFYVPRLVRVYGNEGSHGNLALTGVVDGDVIDVPPGAGKLVHRAVAMPLPAPCDPLAPEGVQGLVGAVAILMEQDDLRDDVAEAGHRELDTALAEELTDFVDGRAILAETTDEEIEAIGGKVQERVEKVITAKLSDFEKLQIASGLAHPDHVLGMVVATAKVSALVDGATEPLTGDFQPSEHPGNHWSMEGTLRGGAVPVLDVLDARLGDGSTSAVRDAVSRVSRPLVADIDRLGEAMGPDVDDVLAAREELHEVVRAALDEVETYVRSPDRPLGRQSVDVIRKAITHVAARSPAPTRRSLLRFGRVVAGLENVSLRDVETVFNFGRPAKERRDVP